ncbi:MAG: hypothetical protein Q7S09_04280 [bacterium]|nr:hypothetical protein [bacterium]
MNIYAKPGSRVVFSHPNNGYPGDQKNAQRHLQVGHTYTVERTEVHSFSTRVFLQEVPGTFFNSVLFEDAKNGQ